MRVARFLSVFSAAGRKNVLFVLFYRVHPAAVGGNSRTGAKLFPYGSHRQCFQFFVRRKQLGKAACVLKSAKLLVRSQKSIEKRLFEVASK